MPNIISASRRTDIPALYGSWFLTRINAGFVGVINPFSGKKRLVSLKSEDVSCIVFWSKNFTPFLDNLQILNKMGYKFMFHYTITGLPAIFENNLGNKESAIKSLLTLSDMYSPEVISWRYDPIIISSATDYDWHIKNFKTLASTFKGKVQRCYISFVLLNYVKVKRNIERFEAENKIKVYNPAVKEKIKLANELADIALDNGIQLYSCCGDYLIGDKIKRASCIDGVLIQELFNFENFSHHRRPTRKGCGCSYSVDIGSYDTCNHGCVYCYANRNKELAQGRYLDHDEDSALLGFSKVESDEWVDELAGEF